MSKIIKVKAGYQAQFSLGSGKQRYRSKHSFKTHHQADEWLAEQTLKFSKSLYYQPQMKFFNFFDLWVNLYKRATVAPATLATYEATSKHLRKYLPEVTLAELSRPILQSYFNVLGRDHATESMRKDKAHISVSLSDAVLDGVITKNPATRLTLVGNDSSAEFEPAKFMPKAQYRAVLSFLTSGVIDCQHIPWMVLRVISSTGLRVGEALALRREDFDEGLLRVDESYDSCAHELKSPKTPNANRRIPITQGLQDCLDEWFVLHDQWLADQKVANPKGLLFLDAKEKLPDATCINYHYQTLQRRLGYTKTYSTHKLRHFIGSQMVMNPDVSLTYIAKFLGHSSEAVTQKYYLGLIPDELGEQHQQALNVLSNI